MTFERGATLVHSRNKSDEWWCRPWIQQAKRQKAGDEMEMCADCGEVMLMDDFCYHCGQKDKVEQQKVEVETEMCADCGEVMLTDDFCYHCGASDKVEQIEPEKAPEPEKAIEKDRMVLDGDVLITGTLTTRGDLTVEGFCSTECSTEECATCSVDSATISAADGTTTLFETPPPILWDRLTGEGPYIDTGQESEHGYRRYYRGRTDEGGCQGYQNCWPATLSERASPELYVSWSGAAWNPIVYLLLGSGVSAIVTSMLWLLV